MLHFRRYFRLARRGQSDPLKLANLALIPANIFLPSLNSIFVPPAKEAGTKVPSLLLFPNVTLERAPKVWVHCVTTANPKPTFVSLP